MTIHLLGGAHCYVGASRPFPLCHPQLTLYDHDELVIDIARVSCHQCKEKWYEVKSTELWFLKQEDEQRQRNQPKPPPEDFVCEGHDRAVAEVERKRRDAVVVAALTEPVL